MDDPSPPAEAPKAQPKKHYGLQRRRDPIAEERGEVGAWLVAEELQLAHGYLSQKPEHARHWLHVSGPHKHLKCRPWLRGKLTVRPFPSTPPLF